MLDYNLHATNAFPSDWPAGDPSSTQQFWLQQTNSPKAWDVRPRGGDYTPVVAVVDTNINIFNADLEENIYINQREIPTEVVRDFDCSPLSEPLPLPTVDTDGDGLITLRDINSSPNREVYNAVLSPDRDPEARIHLYHLVQPDSPADCAPPRAAGCTCGLWEDLADNDGNGHIDDIVGWDFLYNHNVPVFDIYVLGETPQDGDGHGHEVAGVLGAVEDSQSVFPAEEHAPDYVGQAWRLRILPVRTQANGAPEILGPHRSRIGEMGAVHDGLSYAVDMGADVVNMSFTLGCAIPRDDVPVDEGVQCEPRDFEEKERDVRASFNLARLNEPLLVVGPINIPVSLDRDDVQDLPAELRLPNQINVGSVDRNDEYRTDRVSFGTGTFHIAAPSENMIVLNFGGVGSQNPAGTQTGIAGNSLAAPQVAGTAALILSVDPGMRGNPVELRDRILRNAVRLDQIADKVQDGRRLDVERAVKNVVR